MSGRGDDFLRVSEKLAADARILRENWLRTPPKLKATQRSADDEKTRENRNMGQIGDAQKAQVELEGFFQDATAGVKFDAGKLRMDLLPPDALEALARILTAGAVKYGNRNWERGMAWSRPYAALLRHLLAWWGGQDVDPESGHSHLWHVLTNAAFLVAYEQRRIGEDDRPFAGPQVKCEIITKEQVSL